MAYVAKSGAHSTGVTMIHRERKSRKKRDQNAAFPWCVIAMCANDTVDDGVPDMILDFNIVHNSPRIVD